MIDRKALTSCESFSSSHVLLNVLFPTRYSFGNIFIFARLVQDRRCRACDGRRHGRHVCAHTRLVNYANQICLACDWWGSSGEFSETRKASPLTDIGWSGVRARRECAREWMVALINERSQFVRASTHQRLQWIPAIPNPYFLISQTRRIRAIRVHCIYIIIYGRLHMPCWQGGSGCTGQKPRYLFELRINRGTKHSADRIRTFLIRVSVRRWKGAPQFVWVV